VLDHPLFVAGTVSTHFIDEQFSESADGPAAAPLDEHASPAD